MNVETDVLSRYSEAANMKNSDLCCPIDYNANFLQILPKEIIDKDYGCGDPSRHVRPGDTALDRGHEVIYRGPYSKLYDDQGNFYLRGGRITVSANTYELLTKNVDFKNDFIDIPPVVEKTPSDWVLPAGSVRPSSESKGSNHGGSSCCSPSSCC